MESDMRPYEPSQKFPSIPQKFNYLSFISVLIFLLFSCQSFHSFFHIYFLSFFIFHIFDYVILVLKIRRRTFGNRKGRSTVASIKFICQNINTGCVACTGYWREMQNRHDDFAFLSGSLHTVSHKHSLGNAWINLFSSPKLQGKMSLGW